MVAKDAVPSHGDQRFESLYLSSGRIVKTTGDGVLIEFGSVVGVVQCAIVLQKLAAAAGPQFCERPPRARFALDSLLEGAGFEPSAPARAQSSSCERRPADAAGLG